jgi:hypothetical protein
MSNLWFNIRFGNYHWQWGPDGMRWSYNHIHEVERKYDPRWKWFAIYCLFGKHL